MLQQPCRAVPVHASPGLAVPIPQARLCWGCARIARGHRARRWHIHECAHPVVPAPGSSEGARGGRGWWQPGLGAGPQVPPRLGGQLQADAQLSQLPFGIFPNVWGISQMRDGSRGAEHLSPWPSCADHGKAPQKVVVVGGAQSPSPAPPWLFFRPVHPNTSVVLAFSRLLQLQEPVSPRALRDSPCCNPSRSGNRANTEEEAAPSARQPQFTINPCPCCKQSLSGCQRSAAGGGEASNTRLR